MLNTAQETGAIITHQPLNKTEKKKELQCFQLRVATRNSVIAIGPRTLKFAEYVHMQVVSLVPRLSAWVVGAAKKRAWYTLHVHAPNVTIRWLHRMLQ